MTKHFRSRYPRYPDDSDYKTNASSYYDDLARKNKLIEILAEKIYGYEKVLAENLAEIERVLNAVIDKIGEGFNQEIVELLEQWILDGSLDHIINETLMNKKADKKDLIALENTLTKKINDFITETNHEMEKINTSLNQKLKKYDHLLLGFDTDYIKPSFIESKEKRQELEGKQQVRIGTFNYQYGRNFNISFDYNVKEMLERSGSHIIGLQEFGDVAYSPLSKFESRTLPFTSVQRLFSYSFEEHYQVNALIAYQQLTETSSRFFNQQDTQNRGYIKTKLPIYNKEIVIYNTHLTHVNEELRLNQLTQILDDLTTDTSVYKVIVGDFNAEKNSLIDLTNSYNLTIHNDDLPTYTKSETAIDNIITTNNMRLKNIQTITNQYSDHRLLIGDFELN